MTSPAKPIRQIPGTITVVEADGNETHKPMAWTMMPPPPDCCQICARKHDPREPHDAQTTYYKVTFNGMVGRAPTWADAMAHCDEPIRRAWKAGLERSGNWTEPPDGEQPVAHHGVQDGAGR